MRREDRPEATLASRVKFLSRVSCLVFGMLHSLRKALLQGPRGTVEASVHQCFPGEYKLSAPNVK